MQKICLYTTTINNSRIKLLSYPTEHIFFVLITLKILIKLFEKQRKIKSAYQEETPLLQS